MTFRSKVLARTSSSLEKPLFLAIWATLTTSGRVFLTEMVKRHIYGPKPFIWAYNQVSLSFRSKVLARTSSSLEKPLFGLFWPIWQLPVGCFWPKWSKGTSTDQDLSFESITKSLWLSVQKFQPVQAQVLKTRYFWPFLPIWQLPVGCFWPKWSKGTSTDQDFSFEPITKSLWPSVQKFEPVQAHI